MPMITHSREGNNHILVFPPNVTQDEYEDIFSESFVLLGDLTEIRLIIDLSLMNYVNSGFIGMISEMYSMLDEKKGKMVVVANSGLHDIFKFVGFDDFVEIVSTKEEAMHLLK